MGVAYAVHGLLRLRSAVNLAGGLSILLNQLTAQANALGVGPKPLVISQSDNSLRITHQGSGRILQHAALLHELIDGKRAGETSRTAGGKCVVGAGNVVAHRLRRPFTQIAPAW